MTDSAAKSFGWGIIGLLIAIIFSLAQIEKAIEEPQQIEVHIRMTCDSEMVCIVDPGAEIEGSLD